MTLDRASMRKRMLPSICYLAQFRCLCYPPTRRGGPFCIVGGLLNCVYLLTLIVMSPFLAYKAVTTGKYRKGLSAKFTGFVPKIADPRPKAWIHAVSVGEVLLLRPLLEKLRRAMPEVCWVLSTS